MSKAKPIDPPEVIELLQIIADLYATADGFDGVIIRNVGAKYSSKNATSTIDILRADQLPVR